MFTQSGAPLFLRHSINLIGTVIFFQFHTFCLFDCFCPFFVCKILICIRIPRILQTEGSVRCHRKYFPAVRIHHDDTDIFRAFMTAVFHCIIKFRNFTLCDGLKVCINGGYNGITICRIFYFDLIIRIRINISIFFTVNAIQFIIITIFQSTDALVTGCSKSKQRTSQRVVRIISDIFFFKPDTFDIFSCCFIIL